MAATHGGDAKLDAWLRARAHTPAGISRVLIRTPERAGVERLVRRLRGTPERYLASIQMQVARVPDERLHELASAPEVISISLDRAVYGTVERTGVAIGAVWAREYFGVDGRGVGVAIVDSGVTAWHDDLGTDRVAHFADFVGDQPTPYDDYGHGTHVAGIIAGSGYDSNGERRGIAPGAHLVVLKALDATGDGFISTVIAALDYAVEQRARFNIRVINLSVAAPVLESHTTDPLALAARRAVDAGIVVVTAAGNFGRDAKGQPLYGGITAPGNAPWVLTVGAANHNRTARRADDVVAPFSSRGPTQIDRATKPDLVAPGVGIESLADSSSLLFRTHAAARLWGTVDTVSEPYVALSGTSMAAPVVTGTIALMMEANPRLTPNLVKAVLQYTAENRRQYDHFAEGAGFLNARGAVQLARSLAADGGPTAPLDSTPWSRQILWGNQRITGATLKADAIAWRTGVTWGSTATDAGEEISIGGDEAIADLIAAAVFCETAPCAGVPMSPAAMLGAAACAGSDCERDLLVEALPVPTRTRDGWLARVRR
jgi:subtilisin family serine protease